MNRKSPAVPEAAWAALEAYGWPGNVRELENFMQRALILSPGPELRLPELPSAADAPPAPGLASPAAVCAPGKFEDEMRALLERALAASAGRIYGPQGAAALLGLKPSTLQGKLKKYGVEARTGA
jgi:formate hydrogenlyase transcriptional activator